MAVETNLRFRALHPLIGRDGDLERLRKRLATARLVTITGPGGVGKTSLAVVVATERAAPIVDLSAIREADLAAGEIAVAVEADLQADVPTVTRIARAVESSDRLLVLDNLEQIDGIAELLGQLLLAAPRLTIMTTSRHPTGVIGEVAFPVEPLDLPLADTPAAVEASAAATLFLDLGRSHGNDEPLDAGAAKSIAKLVRQLDGLPLALELAAAKLRLYSPDAIARHVTSDPEGFLVRPSAGRHASLSALLDWSIALLTDDERRTLLDVAVIPSTFDLELAHAVAGRDHVGAILEELVQHGLLAVRRGPDGEPRFAMLETIRASCRTDQSEEAHAAAMRRLAGAAFDLVRRHGTRDLMTVTSDISRLAPAGDTIRAALEWTIDHDVELGLEIASRCGDFWRARGAEDIGLGWLDRLLATGGGSPGLRRAAYAVAASTHYSLGHPMVAQATAGRVATEAEAIGDPLAEACARYVLLCIASDRGDADEVDLNLARLETIADAASADESHASILRMRALRAEASAQDVRGDTASAIASNEALAERAAAAGLAALEALARTNMIESLLVVDRPADARRQAERAIVLYETSGPWVGIGWPLAQLARACARMGDEPAAHSALERAVADARAHNNDVVVDSTTEASFAYFVAFGDVGLGCRAFGSSLAAAASAGLAVEAALRRAAAPDLARARRLLGPVNVDVAIAAGLAMNRLALLEEIDAALAVHAPQKPRSMPLRHGELSIREVEVMHLLADGRSDPEIAAALFISPKTASVHVSSIKAKLGVPTRVEAALRAREVLGASTGQD